MPEKPRVYLDNCCFNRPYDDQEKVSVWLETEAKLFIQQLIVDKNVELAWSYMLSYENDKNPYLLKRNAIACWEDLAVATVAPSADIKTVAETTMSVSVKSADALHLACAIAAKCDYFVTVDRRILKCHLANIVIVDPIDLVKRLEEMNHVV